jgi:hypothetical protein
MAFLGRFFSLVATIRLCPGALSGLIRFIAYFMSTGVKALTGSDSWLGAFKSAPISPSLFLSEFDVKTLARCSANTVDFSLVELTHFSLVSSGEVWELSAF